MQKNAAYIRPKGVGPFSKPYTNRSYLHRAARHTVKSGNRIYHHHIIQLGSASTFLTRAQMVMQQS
jgi:hypothetical protein